MPVPNVGIANWIKNGANVAAAAGTPPTVTIEAVDVVASTGTIIATAQYADDIRDFLVATLDRVFATYSALATADKPTTFAIQRALTGSQVQYVVTVTTNGNVDFPTWG
jgi:hypothetical protein